MVNQMVLRRAASSKLQEIMKELLIETFLIQVFGNIQESDWRSNRISTSAKFYEDVIKD